jgi:C_GCAxxG_C_C family probable redox protein
MENAMTIKTDPELDALVMKHARPNCAQTSFLAMTEALELDVDAKDFEQALTAYPGIGHTGETCGAITGPLLAIGLAVGPKDAADAEQTMKAGAAAHHFCTAVSGEFGSTRCAEIIERFYGKPVDFTDPAQIEAYVAAGGQAHCLSVIQAAVTVAKGVIDESTRKDLELQPH